MYFLIVRSNLQNLLHTDRLLGLWEVAQQAGRVASTFGSDLWIVSIMNDSQVEQHLEVKKRQGNERYSRTRIARPANTWQQEQANFSGAHSTVVVIEQVFAFADRNQAEHACNEVEPLISKIVDKFISNCPIDAYAHTNLNQRLTPRHYAICCLLLVYLSRQKMVLNHGMDMRRICIAYGAILRVFSFLCLDHREQLALLNQGIDYLQNFLAIENDWISVDKVATAWQALSRELQNSSIALCADKNRYLSQEDPAFLFPESAWHQMHWFMSQIGLDVRQELILYAVVRMHLLDLQLFSGVPD